MISRFSKAALLSAALFGLGFAAVANTTTNASAKSYAKVKSNSKFTINSAERNYLPSGSAALYTKAGTLKGARKVASTSTMSRLANQSDNGQTYFRAYRIAKTNRGSYYLKVVSFDKTYRGWIYAGKSNPSGKTAVGGMKKVSTFDRGSLTTDISNATYSFKSSSQTYVQPDWTQYKVGRNTASTNGDYMKDSLRVTAVGNKTNGRDGNAKYYYVEDSAHPTVNGWIKASDVTTGASSSSTTTIGQDQVKVSYVDATTGQEVTSKILTNTNYKTQTAAAFLGTNTSGQAYSNIPTGYSAPAASTANATTNNNALTAAQYGGTVKFIVNAASANANLFDTAATYTTKADSRQYNGLPGDPVGKNAYTSPQGVQLNTLIAKLAKSSYTSSNNGQRTTFTAQDVMNAVSGANMDTIYYLTYTDPMTNLIDWKHQAILTASSTGTPSVSGLFGTTSGSSSDTMSQLSNILAGSDAFGSILSGLGNVISGGIDAVGNFLFGGIINYRVVHLTTSVDAIRSANGDSIKMGSQVVIPYTATASNVIRKDAVKNNLDGVFTTAGADSDQSSAFNAKTFASSTSTVSSLVDGSTSASGTNTTANTASAAASSSSNSLWSNLFGNLFG